MAKSRRNAQIGLFAAIVVLAACLGVLAFQSDGAKAKVPGAPMTTTATQSVTQGATLGDTIP